MACFSHLNADVKISKNVFLGASAAILSLAIVASPAPPAAQAGTKYEKFNFAKEISKDQLQKVIQTMVKQTYLVGFRTLGNAEDFFHGHVIYDGNNTKPELILFHTQERAFLYALYDP